MTDRSPPVPGRTRRHVWLDDDDWEWIRTTFDGKLTPSNAIRTIIKKFRKGIEARAEGIARRPTVGAGVVDEVASTEEEKSDEQ